MRATGICRIAVGVGVLSLGIGGWRGVAQGTASAKATVPSQSLTVGNKKYDTEKELARMIKRYSLTEEERAKIQPILLEQQKQVHTLGEDESLSNSAWSSAVRKVHLLTVAQVKLQMTDAQASKYAKDEVKRAKDDGDADDSEDGPDGPPPDGPPPGGGPGGGGPPSE
jgi:hypothetical protein